MVRAFTDRAVEAVFAAYPEPRRTALMDDDVGDARADVDECLHLRAHAEVVGVGQRPKVLVVG